MTYASPESERTNRIETAKSTGEGTIGYASSKGETGGKSAMKMQWYHMKTRNQKNDSGTDRTNFARYARLMKKSFETGAGSEPPEKIMHAQDRRYPTNTNETDNSRFRHYRSGQDTLQEMLSLFPGQKNKRGKDRYSYHHPYQLGMYRKDAGKKRNPNRSAYAIDMTVAMIEQKNTGYSERQNQPETKPDKILRPDFKKYDPPLEQRVA